jgi:hypothetical protein
MNYPWSGCWTMTMEWVREWEWNELALEQELDNKLAMD